MNRAQQIILKYRLSVFIVSYACCIIFIDFHCVIRAISQFRRYRSHSQSCLQTTVVEEEENGEKYNQNDEIKRPKQKKIRNEMRESIQKFFHIPLTRSVSLSHSLCCSHARFYIARRCQVSQQDEKKTSIFVATFSRVFFLSLLLFATITCSVLVTLFFGRVLFCFI